MSLYTLDERLKTVEEQVEAFLSIMEMNTRLTSDGTEYVPISLPDGTEYKMLLTTAFKKPFYNKIANYELVSADKNSVIVMDGNSLTLTIPDSLGWNKGDSCIAIVYGTGFTLANGGSVTVNSPQSFTDVNKSVYLIHKTETDEFSVVQLGQASGGGGGSGTVTSVAQTVPTGFTVSGTPITSSGTLAISYDTGYQGYTTAEASKLSGIEAGADVTDATNVASAGAVMDGDFSSNGIMERTGAGTYGVVTKPSGDLVGTSDSQTLTNKTIAYGSNTISGLPCEFIVAVSDETTNLTTGTAKVTFRMPYAMTLQTVRANVNTAPVGSTIIVDINETGSTILSTKLSIDAGEKTSTTATTAAVISDSSLADDAEITIDIDQVGSSTPGKGLKVLFKGIRA